jgi:hypothetical protein
LAEHLWNANNFLQNRSRKSTIYPRVPFSPRSSTPQKILNSHISYVLSTVWTSTSWKIGRKYYLSEETNKFCLKIQYSFI